MRILFINQHFQPEPNFFMGLPFAKELVRRGHEVEVLTGFPNYPGGKIYDGYRIKPLQKEVLEGIPVIRVPLFPSHDRSSVRRIACYTSFALSASTIGLAATKPADVAYIDQGPATIGLPGCVFRFVRSIPFVYHIMDLWPDCLPATGMFTNPFGIWLIGKWCQFAYRKASKIVAITPGYKQKLCERGVPEEKVEVVYNWCDDSQIIHVGENKGLADAIGMTGRFNIVFAGNMGKGQALDTVLEAAKIIEYDCPRVQFLLFGGGVEADSLKQKAAAMGLKKVRFFERRPVSEIGAILSLADVLLVHLKDEPVYRITIPSKTQAYLAIGKPILVGMCGDTADLVTKAKAGIACEPENPRSMAEAVRKLQSMPKIKLDEMGANGKKYYEQNLSFAIATEKFERIFESVINEWHERKYRGKHL